jgi:citrate lyase gamma subunit
MMHILKGGVAMDVDNDTQNKTEETDAQQVEETLAEQDVDPADVEVTDKTELIEETEEQS